MKKSVQNPPSILSKELKRHYEKHGVVGIESFITNKDSAVSSSSASCKNEDINCSKDELEDSYKSSRFVRLNPRFDERETLELLCAELPLDIKPIQVPWISNKLQFYAIPSTFSLVKSKLFQSGRIYGMDISSGAAVAALLLDEHDRDDSNIPLEENIKKQEKGNEGGMIMVEKQTSFRVLDLCCAPGLKTCAVADLLSVHPQNKNMKNVRIIGVDISEQRIQLCKNIITKYQIDKSTSGIVKEDDEEGQSKKHNQSEKSIASPTITASYSQPRISLYCTDGTSFGKTNIDSDALIFDSIVAREEENQKGTRKRMNKSARARQRKRLRNIAQEDEYCRHYAVTTRKKTKYVNNDLDINSEQNHSDSIGENREVASCIHGDVIVPLFDRVLVDAECSTDGAVRHIKLRHHQQNEDIRGNNLNSQTKSRNHDYTQNHKLTDGTKLAKLVDLQKRLIQSGFTLLRPGGVLVYSTCSLATEQNEDVVSWLLQTYDEAFVIPVKFKAVSTGQDHASMIHEGSIEGSVRFHPNVVVKGDETEINDSYFFGGGFFLVKIGKKRY